MPVHMSPLSVSLEVLSTGLVLFNVQEYSRLPTYPVYGTLNDTYDYFHTNIDPSFNVTTALVRVLCDIVLRLADSAILPFNVRGYDIILDRGLSSLKEHREKLESAGLKMGECVGTGVEVLTHSVLPVFSPDFPFTTAI